jgi:hypothetical protein
MPALSAELLSKANAAAIHFIQTEVETGLSFARMAILLGSHEKARPGDAKKMKRYLGHARLAYDTAARRLRTAKATAEQMREINLKLSGLRKLLGLDQKEL